MSKIQEREKMNKAMVAARVKAVRNMLRGFGDLGKGFETRKGVVSDLILEKPLVRSTARPLAFA